MVRSPGATLAARRIRHLKSPQTLLVEPDEQGRPLRIDLGHGWQDVTLTRRPWRIDQHWWRAEHIQRDYYQVACEDGPPLTLYHDLVSGGWARQEYG